MKTLKIKYIIIALIIAVGISSCNEDFLTVEPKGTALEQNYYRNETEAYSALIATYDIIGKNSSGFENMITMMNAGSDDHNAGGGSATDGAGIHAFNNYTINSTTVPSSFWDNNFQGIFRANVLLSKLPKIPMDDTKKLRFAAECKALRAFYNFELVRMFKNIPLLTSTVSPNDIASVIQSNPTAVYAQIEKDLIEAITDLPINVSASENNDERGRLNKGAAQALLGKVYLYEGKNNLAAVQLAEVNGTPGGTSVYGYKLVPVFKNLWTIGSKFNTESIIEINHTNKSNATYGNWGGSAAEGNLVNQMIGPRGYTKLSPTAPDFASGWSFNPVTQSLYDVMKTDPRFDATIADLKALKQQGKINYAPGDQDTGYFLKKFMPLNSDISSEGGEAVLNYRQNTYAIRLADTYLMEAEALGGTGTRAQALLNAVRARVGLSPITVSIDNIMAERRLELAGEGHRWFDLVRTGRAATILATKGFIAGKNEIWPIALKELTNTSIVQNPGYN